MSERKKIEERLRKKEQEIVVLDEKIKAAKIYAQALRDILKILNFDISEDVESEGNLRAGSAVDQTRRVILESGTPLHIDAILSALGKEVTRESKASLTSSLAAYVRRNEIFTRPAPNTFGLAELGHEAQEVDLEPPTTFGKQVSPDYDLDEDIPF